MKLFARYLFLNEKEIFISGLMALFHLTAVLGILYLICVITGRRSVMLVLSWELLSIIGYNIYNARGLLSKLTRLNQCDLAYLLLKG